MSEQHTRGPWAWNEGGRLFSYQVGATYSENVLVVHDPIWRPNAADANLIAAAPDMLEALETAREWLAGWASAETELAQIDVAIAKAKGEQP